MIVLFNRKTQKSIRSENVKKKGTVSVNAPKLILIQFQDSVFVGTHLHSIKKIRLEADFDRGDMAITQGKPQGGKSTVFFQLVFRQVTIS